jgi:G:T-mismatch repair DNA endonuclease (very short patch repair protein)
MTDTQVSKEPFGILKQFYRAKLIADHARALRSWPRWQQIGHRLLVGWRCEGCRAYRKSHVRIVSEFKEQ